MSGPIERPKRTRAPAPAVAPASDAGGSMRLSKRMAELGLCSRREADEWIERGWVFVDGVRTDVLGSKVVPGQKITVTRAAEHEREQRVTVLINKPVGLVSGQAEDGYTPASTLVVPAHHWRDDPRTLATGWRPPRGLAPAGRLDIDSTGLLVLTQDGRIARQLINDDSDVEKEYLVRVAGTLGDDGLRLLGHGLTLDGVPAPAGAGRLAERRAVALRPPRGSQAPGPPDVRTRRTACARPATGADRSGSCSVTCRSASGATSGPTSVSRRPLRRD